MKKRGFGTGRWNGFGGKVQPEETLEEASKREAFEECNLIVKTLEKRGELNFSFDTHSDVLEVHVFLATQWQGKERETEEMKPKWFAFENIPYKEMWSDDEFWLPLFLEGKCLKGRFHFDKNDQVLQKEVSVVQGF